MCYILLQSASLSSLDLSRLARTPVIGCRASLVLCVTVSVRVIIEHLIRRTLNVKFKYPFSF